MLCRVIPYEGKEPYIFLSYCHKDARRVYPIMEQMAKDGYRIWYDDGNHPGDDWLENIAQHLNGCALCLAMLSENAAASHNCRSELSFAVECEKPLLAVLLEDFAMPLGMKLQLGTIQHLKYGDYATAKAMLKKLYEANALAACKAGCAEGLLAEAVSPQDQKEIDTPDSKQADGDAKKRTDSFLPKGQRGDSGAGETPDSDIPTEQDIWPRDKRKAEQEEETPTVRAEDHMRVVLLHPATGACYLLNSPLIRVGRSERRCDIVISDNPSISNHHADIIRYNGRCYLRDAGSVNGTFVHDERLPAEGRAILRETDVFRLYNETFQIVSGDAAVELLAMEKTVVLRNPRDGQARILIQNRTTVGRDKPITGQLLDDPKVSRNHAEIFWRDNVPYICDLSSKNGTYLNAEALKKETARALHQGDTLRMGDTSLEVHILTLRGEAK